MIDGYMTTKDIAELLGVTPKTVRQYLWRGDMPKEDMKVQQMPLWKEATIKAWQKERKSVSWNRKK